MRKVSKEICYFEQICKEINLFKKKVEDCIITQARVKDFKDNIKQLKNNLINVFSKLNFSENDDSFSTYLEYKEKMLELLIYLEEKTDVVLNSESRSESKVKSNIKNSLVKLPKFDLLKLYRESDGWISFKELFVSTVIKNEQLSKIEKLMYLHSSVQGKAAKSIRGFSLRQEN